MKVSFTPQFIRQFKKLQLELKEDAWEKIELFENPRNHENLKVHKLSGTLSGRYSFSINYKYRIIFMWEVKNKSAILLAIGDHSVYS